MTSAWLFVLALSALLFAVRPATAGPVIPGLGAKHPLTESQVGRLLIGELRCAACHTDPAASRSPERTAPNLAEVGSRVSPDYLKQFIASPSTTHAGTTMPDLLSAESAEQRDKIADALTHFLIARSKKPFDRQQAVPSDAATGRSLFHSVGCVTCHSPRDEQRREITTDNVVTLGHVPSKYSRSSLRDFLFLPMHVRPSGRMPDMKLTPDEAGAIANDLIGPAVATAEPVRPQETLVALGQTYFQQYKCASCHTLGDIPPAKPVSPLNTADLTRGCLAEKPGTAPHFHMSAGQLQAIRAALRQNAEPVTDSDRLAISMTAFNCLGCHVRGGFGGVSEELSDYFQTNEKELGDDGRIPPHLTLIGAKLQTVAMKKVLFDGEIARPHMATRMPQYGESNIGHLPELFARLDRVKPVTFTLPKPEPVNAKEREREKAMRAAGRELVGDKGLNCIACHTFNGKAAGKTGIDLLTATERLQPSFFFHYLQNPAAFRPRTIMPTSWPNGEAMLKTVLNGDTERQIEAIWYYLSLGTSAPEPSGLRSPDTLLMVSDAPRTYRGRSSVAGYRGIAVGFPEKWNYAFNAETGTLSALWRGDFIRVNRGGQGSGGFNPAAKSVLLAQDLSFHALSDETTAWPLRPVMTKDAPANPNPLYPKNLGYQFLGYEMDDASVPTFLYRSGEISIRDRSAVQVVDSKPRLVRTFTFESPDKRTVWYRALTGKVESESKTVYKSAEVTLVVPDVPMILRPTSPDAKSSELLLRFEIPQGSSSKTLIYDIRP